MSKSVAPYDGVIHPAKGMYVSWPVQPHREGIEIETDAELYQLLQRFDEGELPSVAVYRGDAVESGTVALERLHEEWGE